LTLFAALAIAAPATSPGATIDGQLDAEYGPPLSTQTVQTSFGDTPPGYNPPDALQRAIGSELDQAYAYVSGGVLYLMLTGNLKSYVGEPLIPPDQLEVFIDSKTGGQNPLRADNPATGAYLRLSDLAGLAFDTEFVPDYWIQCLTNTTGPDAFFLYSADLPSASGGTGNYLGRTGGGGPGTLSGGDNPYGIMASFDQRNRAGVTAGCGPALGAGATMGIELAIPLAAIDASGPIRICVVVDHIASPQVSNQVLGPVPPGTCSFASPAGVDFAAIPGAQYFTLGAPTPVRSFHWGRLKSLYR
jgi:hypothetical protein